MRIITGRFKGRSLYSVEGHSTRPTTAFNREALFSMFQDYQGRKVLDLFAGTGSFGLEALSRGAVWVDFVEFASPAIKTLLANIAKLGCGQECHVWRKRVEAFLGAAEADWDLIFLDPPYDKGLINPTLSLIFERGLLKQDGIVIAEHSPREAVEARFRDRLIKHKSGKTTAFTLLSA